MILGILAGTMEMSPHAWNGRNVEGKLTALAIGLSTMSDMDQVGFEKVYAKTFRELNIQGDIKKLLGKSIWRIVGRTSRRTNANGD